MLTRLCGAFVGLTIVMLATAAHAQTAPAKANSLGEVSVLVKPGEQIEVVRSDGPVVTGHLRQVSEAGITLDAAGKVVQLPASVVDQIAKRGDSVADGALIGAAVGAASGLAWTLFWYSVHTESDDKAADKDRALPVIGMSAAIGAGIGAAIDAAIVRRVVVFGEGRVAVAPLVGKHRRGLALVLSF